MRWQLRIAVLAGVFAASACQCSNSGVGRSDGVLVTDASASGGIDFGVVRVGETVRKTLVIFNNGTGKLALQELQRTGTYEPFSRPQFPALLEPNQSETLTISFSPEEEGDFEARFVFKTDSGETPEVEVRLLGRGVVTRVVVEPVLVDFGLREVGTRETRLVRLRNDGEIPEHVKVTPFPDQSPHYALGSVLDDEGYVALDPGASVDLPVVFAPAYPGARLSSSIEVLPCESCNITEILVKGDAIAAFVVVDPEDCLDFGLVNPGAAVERTFTLGNLGDRPVQVSAAVVDSGSEFFSVARVADYPFSLGRDQSHPIAITYAPQRLEENAGSIVVTTDDPTHPEVRLCVRGAGGGPDALVSPPALDFGLVAVGTTRSKPVRLTNVGIAGSGAADLVIGSASFPSGSYYATDLTPPMSVPYGASRTMLVTYAPTVASDAAGHVDTLRIGTNDSDAPEVEVRVAGRAVELPPCNLELVPGATLAFGNVEKGRTSVLRLSLRNAGDAQCLISGLDLEGTGSSAFSLPSGPIAERVLEPLEVLSVPVQFKPTAAGRVTRRLAFDVSDPAAPHRTVELTGLSENGCLLIAPNEIDFGTVGAQCASRTVNVTVYNVCPNTQTVRVESIGLAADPASPFVLVATPPSFPVTVTSGTPVAFSVRYVPQALGTDAGAVFVKSTERVEPYNVGLRGRAADDAIQRDRFLQERKPSVDLLFVVDNSGSMSEEQAALASNFDAFMRYANQQQIDYHIGVTTTDVTNNGANGRLIPVTPTNRPRLLTPLTTNVESEFATTVNVGVNGSGDEQGLHAAFRALSSPGPSDTPLASGGNGGFLRTDSLLSIIVVSDEEDYSPQGVAFYLNFLRNVKGANRANLVNFSVVCDFADCARYETVAGLTGGIKSDIKTDNWSADLERLGAVAFGYKTRFFLTSVPANPRDLVVLIDGLPVPEFDGTIRNWTFLPDSNAIDFSVLSLPEPGSVLEVSYLVACGR